MKHEEQASAMSAAIEAEAEPEPEIKAEPGLEGEGETLLDLVLAEHLARTEPEPQPARVDGIVVARLAAIGAGGEPALELPWSREPRPSRSMIALVDGDVGCEVAVLFEGGDPQRPVVMGRMHVAARAASSTATATATATSAPEVETDGDRLVFSAEKEIVLRCGKSSLTLTRAGKILIRGAYVLTRSSGVNRIQGGSVQIN